MIETAWNRWNNWNGWNGAASQIRSKGSIRSRSSNGNKD